MWVNGDDGVVRGIEASSGKVVRVLRKGGHEAGAKVRCLWAGYAGRKGRGERLGEEEEVLISGGFDRRLVVWSV